MKKLSTLVVLLLLGGDLIAQKIKSDTTKHLKEVEVVATRERIQIERLPDVKGTYLNAGKKK